MSNHVPMAPFMPPAGPMHPYHGPHGPHHHHHAHGFCTSCCHPVSQCMCHRDCRKIEKELLVRPTASTNQTPTGGTTGATTGYEPQGMATESVRHRVFAMMDLTSPTDESATEEETANTDAANTKARISSNNITQLRQLVIRQQAAASIDTTVIGGGCCVHLSVEYMPLNPLQNTLALSAAMVIDSQSTVMLWGKYFNDEGYHVKQSIITTNPGAHLTVLSINSVTRVRWCEIISC